MSTTVTTSVTTVTTLGIGAALSVILTLTLVGLLVGRELAGASASERAQIWRRVSLVGVVPLLLSFGVVLGAKVAAIW